MNDFIFNVVPTQAPTIPMWVPLLGGFPINSPLVGSFLGVFSAFLINYAYQSYNNHKKKNYYKDLFQKEMEESAALVSGFLEVTSPKIEMKEQEAGLIFTILQELPIEYWTSCLNSGDLKLFKIGEAITLSNIYFFIKEINEERRVLLDLINDYPKTPKEEQQNLKMRIERQKWLNDERSKALKEKMENLLESEWFKNRTCWKDFWRWIVSFGNDPRNISIQLKK